MLWYLAAVGTGALTPIAGGYITQTYGWRTQFKIISAFSGIALLLIIFACPEHTFVRDLVYETDVVTFEASVLSGAKSAATVDHGEKDENSADGLDASRQGDTDTGRVRAYFRELKPFNGTFSNQSPFILLARPFVCMLYPAVFWGFIVGGLWLSWVSFVIYAANSYLQDSFEHEDVLCPGKSVLS